MTRPYEGRHAPRVPALITRGSASATDPRGATSPLDRRAVRIRTAQRIAQTYTGKHRAA